MTRTSPSARAAHPDTEPHTNPGLEMEVLGMIMRASRKEGAEVLPQLEASLVAAPEELMSTREHQAIWQAIRGAVTQGHVPTPYELRHTLPEVSQDTWARIQQADQADQLEPNIRELQKLVGARRVRRATNVARQALLDGEHPEDVIVRLAGMLQSADMSSVRPVPVKQLGSTMNHLRARREGKIKKVSTGFSGLDRRLGGGIEVGSYVLLGMSTNIGKTRLAMLIVLRLLEAGAGVVYLSGEMKMTAGGQEYGVHRVKMGLTLMKARFPVADDNDTTTISRETEARVVAAEEWLDASGLQIHDRVMTVDAVSSIARQMKRAGQVMMVIDNLNHVSLPGFKGQTWELRKEVSERLGEIAHDNGVVILVLVQTKIDSKVERPPQLDEVAEAVSISNPADIVITGWRPLPSTDLQARSPDAPPLDRGLVSIIKNRNGRKGTVRVGWDEARATWYDLEQGEGA